MDESAVTFCLTIINPFNTFFHLHLILFDTNALLVLNATHSPSTPDEKVFSGTGCNGSAFKYCHKYMAPSRGV